jgi:hypothetical protein
LKNLNYYSFTRKFNSYFDHKFPSEIDKVIIAETKQAIATLYQVGSKPENYYPGFPSTSEKVIKYLNKFDWQKPWAAGGQAAALAVFLKTQSPYIYSTDVSKKLIKTCAEYFKNLVDPVSGGYFKGKSPGYNELVNGAMKILTAFDWLETPVHYPEKLLETVLSQEPSNEGCHLVDSIYVIYQCCKYTKHKREDVVKYCLKILTMIQMHYNGDGGFSYFIKKSQTNYYGAKISEGKAESDIHGTILLTWALVMCSELLEINQNGWRLIKP